MRDDFRGLRTPFDWSLQPLRTHLANFAIGFQQVCLYAAEQLIAVLTSVRLDDRETQAGLDRLRNKMGECLRIGAPWRARSALDVIAALDMAAWAVLLALTDECPVLHAGVGSLRDSRIHTVHASDYEFISENRQVASAREYLRSLPETLRC